MEPKFVVNASPLIVLAKIEHVHLLEQLSAEFVIPEAVIIEINAGSNQDAAKRLLTSHDLSIVSSPVPSAELTSWDLGAGETAVIAFAMANAGWTAILDDRAARRSAQALGISVMGTLGIILKAKQTGLIPSAAEVLQQIIDHDFRIDNQLLTTVLPKTVSESWPPES